MNAFEKSQAERDVANKWFDGVMSESEAKSQKWLSSEMIDYWYGRRYEQAAKAEALSNEWNS